MSLADLIEKSNDVHLRSQAIDTFMQITSGESFDWFAPSDPQSALLHLRMLELYRSKLVYLSYFFHHLHSFNLNTHHINESYSSGSYSAGVEFSKHTWGEFFLLTNTWLLVELVEVALCY